MFIEKNKTPPQGRGEMKRFATEENEATVAIPPVVETTIIVVQPQLVIVAIDVEQVRVAIRVGNMQSAVHITAQRESLKNFG